MRHIAFFAALAVAGPALAQRTISPADPTSESQSPADTSNPAWLGDNEQGGSHRTDEKGVKRPAPASVATPKGEVPHGEDRGYPAPHEPESPRK